MNNKLIANKASNYQGTNKETEKLSLPNLQVIPSQHRYTSVKESSGFNLSKFYSTEPSIPDFLKSSTKLIHFTVLCYKNPKYASKL